MLPVLAAAAVCCVPAALVRGLAAQEPAAREPNGTPPADTAAERASHERMVKTLAELAVRMRTHHKYHGDGTAREIWADLEKNGRNASWKTRLEAALAHLRFGRAHEAITILQEAVDGLRDGWLQGGDAAKVSICFNLGMAWLRLGETENCCARSSPESCILPLAGRALHERKEGSTNAIPWFELVMANTPPDDYWHLGARWLLNVAHMTLGQWPDAVPEAARMPIDALTSKVAFPRFANVAGEVGLDMFAMLGGAVADDFDGDGDLDLLLSVWSTDGQLRYFRNDGDGTFVDATEAAGLIGITGGINMFQADYDGDGDLDVVLLRGAWLYDNGRHPNSLLRNRGDGTFVDVAYAAGIAGDDRPSSQADWADYDNDGDLDLYVGNETTPKIHAPCQLFRNDGDGTFTDVAEHAGVENLGYTKGVTFGDYDGDGHVDLFVSNLANPNRLYHNRGDGTFEEIAEKLGMHEPIASFPTWFWDFDNDGNLDLFVAAYSTGIGHVAAHHLGVTVRASTHDHLRLWRGDGKGGFTDVAKQKGLDYPALPMGANFGDLDNDGWLDFYLGTGDPYYHSLMPNLMYRNDGGERFVDVSMAGGFAHLQKGHSITFADLDGDLDLDVYAVMGGAYPGDPSYNALYENPGFGNRALVVQLVGKGMNTSAIGAKLRADFSDGGRSRSIHRVVNSGGSFGANPLRQTLGVGKADQVDRLEIVWPGSLRRETLEDLPVGATIRIVEGEGTFTRIDVPRTRLGG